jgi:hypothetical protein
LPQGVALEELCHRARKLRNRPNATLGSVAKELGIAPKTCRYLIEIVEIADRPDLSPRDAALAATALKEMRTGTRSLPEVFAPLEPIATRLWGPPESGERRSMFRTERETLRLDRFKNSFGFIAEACRVAAQMVVPHLSPELARECELELDEAVRCLHELVKTMKERQE